MDVQSLRNRIATLKRDEPKATAIGFVMGHFIEFFFDDAERVSEALQIVLTYRNRNGDEKIPMCGFPSTHIVVYAKRLEELGILVGVASGTEANTEDRLIDDAVPVALAELSDATRLELFQSMKNAELNKVRAAALHERIANYGLGKQADVLNIRDMLGDELDALEVIVLSIEAARRVPDGQGLH